MINCIEYFDSVESTKPIIIHPPIIELKPNQTPNLDFCVLKILAETFGDFMSRFGFQFHVNPSNRHVLYKDSEIKQNYGTEVCKKNELSNEI